MGVDLWKHMLRPFNIWNTFSDLGRYIIHGLLIGTQVSWCILAGAYQRMSVLLAVGRLWRGHLTAKTQVKTSTKRVSFGQKWPNHGTRVEWEYKPSITWNYLCSDDFKKQAFSPFWCASSHLYSTTCYLGKPDGAARDVVWIARCNFKILGGNVSARAAAKPSPVKWFHLVPPEYYLTATEKENADDWNTFVYNLMIIIIYCTPITHGPHKFTQILVISAVNIDRGLTLLINKISYICEGQSWWWVRII